MAVSGRASYDTFVSSRANTSFSRTHQIFGALYDSELKTVVVELFDQSEYLWTLDMIPRRRSRMSRKRRVGEFEDRMAQQSTTEEPILTCHAR